MDSPPFVSICIITGGNIPHLDACLSSISSQENAPPFEVIVCSNGGPDVGRLVRSRLPSALVGHAERCYLGAARNPLIRRATGEWLLFLDDDVTIRPNFLSDLHKLAKSHPEVAVLGGPNDTPKGTPLFEVIQGAILASILVSGPVRRRYGAHPPGPADERFFTLCNLAVRREAMISFPSQLIGAEENAVLAELHRRGLVMYYDPQLAAFHERRPTLRTFAAQMFKYGLGRGQLTRHNVSTLRLPYVVPSAFVVYSSLALGFAGVQPLLLAPMAAYFAAVGATALKIDWGLHAQTRKHVAVILTAGVLAVTVHVCYGLGFLCGLAIGPYREVQEPVPAAPTFYPEPANPEAPELTPTS